MVGRASFRPAACAAALGREVPRRRGRLQKKHHIPLTVEVCMSEDGFLRAILAQPNDDNVRLVYADWLEEQGDPGSASRAEFLRLTAELGAPVGRKGRRKALR